jgi:hypothetical protein
MSATTGVASGSRADEGAGESGGVPIPTGRCRQVDGHAGAGWSLVGSLGPD